MARCSAIQLTDRPIPLVRIALVGVGRRGLRTLDRFSHIEGATFVALADLRSENELEAKEILRTSGRDIPRFFSGVRAVEEVCRMEGVDLVMICTDWYSHAPIARLAMEQGKHVAVEVPACMSLDECYLLMHTAEQTRRHLFLMENCCYDPFALSTLQLHQQGLLGEIKHCEGGYLHNLVGKSKQLGTEDSVLLWMKQHPWSLGNAYPTHGIGPIAHLLGIHRGDKFESIYSVSSNPHLPYPYRTNTTMIRTRGGRLISLQLDLQTPQPYSRVQTISASSAFLSRYPHPIVQLSAMEEALVGSEATQFLSDHYLHPIEKRWGEEGRRKGVENVMNYMMDARLIYCLNEGLPLDIDLYDAVEWSAIIELSARSEQEGRPIPFPDFTLGLDLPNTGVNYAL